MKIYVYNAETGLVLAVITGEMVEAQKAAERFIDEKKIESMFYKTGGYSPDSPEGESFIRYAKKWGLINSIAIRDGYFNSHAARHFQCVEINL